MDKNTGLAVLTAEPSIVCSDASVSFRRMRIVGGIAIVFVGLGLPTLFSGLLYRYRHEIYYDQLLRVRNEGETPVTNKYIRTRRRFRKLYEDYKPKFGWWKLVLLFRKLALALTGILLSNNATAQVHPRFVE